jgi:FdhD protein
MLMRERTLAEEVPVDFSYGGATHAVLMATPDDLEDFALGFPYTEGIITAAAEIAELAVVSVADGIVLRMWFYMLKAIMAGRGDELVDLARTNLWQQHAGAFQWML